MANASAGNAFPGSKTGVRIVVAGVRGVGKSSLICTAATSVFPANVPPVLPPTRLPENFYPDCMPLTIIDTSSRWTDRAKLREELRRADAVVLTYACDQLTTLYELGIIWLPELRHLEVKVPVIVVGCKLDLIDEHQQIRLDNTMASLKFLFWEIETCIKCSAYRQIQIPEVLYYAQKAVLHPVGPLFDQKTRTLKPCCVRALRRIFLLCDHDRDGALSDAELNDLQVKCFNAPLLPSEIGAVKRILQAKLLNGVNKHGLTLTGFQFLYRKYIETGHPETTWTVLRKFGYDNDIKLAENLNPCSFERSPDQSVELTNEAIEHLKRIFKSFDADEDGVLQPTEIKDLFSTAPEFPWNEPPYKDAVEKTALGGLSLGGFLSQWALMAMLDPARTLENLICIGYPGDPSSALHVTKTRRSTRETQQSGRNVYQCLVFGPKKAGKSALLDCFLGRPFSDTYSPTTDERYAVNFLEQPGEAKEILVLREIPEDRLTKMLANKESLAACDMAFLFYDRLFQGLEHAHPAVAPILLFNNDRSRMKAKVDETRINLEEFCKISDESSWKRATELLVEVTSHGEITGFEGPCCIVAAKNDLKSFPLALQKCTRFSEDMGIEAPIHSSMKRAGMI